MSAVISLNPERREYNQHLVTELQQERQQVWSLYCKVAGFKPFACSSQMQTLLNQFSQLLIDYVSLGHFGIYECLLSRSEPKNAILMVAKKIYPEFSKTTEAVMLFNDKYDDNKHLLSINELKTDLSILGESLAKRIEFEETLCYLILLQ